MSGCSVEGCANELRARGLCGKHYQRFAKYGDVNGSAGRIGRTAETTLGKLNPNWRGGKSEHPLYDVYNEMLARCTRPNHKKYVDYGGRGIRVCDRWRADFWAFVEDMGPRPAGKYASGRAVWSIDRIDNNRGYEPGNCRWATALQQAHNKRGFGDSESRRDVITGRYASQESVAA